MELKITGWDMNLVAQKIANDIPDGSYVNLGIGIPELVANHIPKGKEIIFHTENGLLGMGPQPEPDKIDPELINAGKKSVSAIPGACYFHHADSFMMIRGGHIDYCVLGAFQVSQEGDLANWSTGEPNSVPAVGGAMDLVAGVKNVFVITTHLTKKGEPKIVKECTYPLTGKNVVNKIYTNLAVIEVIDKKLFVLEMAPGVEFNFLQSVTEAELHTKT
ncbi:3-oxoacid CoA-transferase subunit B [Ignavibacterium sp.]|uniref:3-oxoacid CoA-transferase subunit B n=1 Tax=Ignavibacterium sp. TaxID=2651167 RepID=UPI00307E2C55